MGICDFRQNGKHSTKNTSFLVKEKQDRFGNLHASRFVSAMSNPRLEMTVSRL
jgi:hypothetical protein